MTSNGFAYVTEVLYNIAGIVRIPVLNNTVDDIVMRTEMVVS